MACNRLLIATEKYSGIESGVTDSAENFHLNDKEVLCSPVFKKKEKLWQA